MFMVSDKSSQLSMKVFWIEAYQREEVCSPNAEQYFKLICRKSFSSRRPFESVSNKLK